MSIANKDNAKGVAIVVVGCAAFSGLCWVTRKAAGLVAGLGSRSITASVSVQAPAPEQEKKGKAS